MESVLLTFTQKKIFACYVGYAKFRGVCYAATQTIANKVGCSKRTVQRAIKLFEEKGLINIERRKHCTSHVTILRDWRPPKKVASESPKSHSDDASMSPKYSNSYASEKVTTTTPFLFKRFNKRISEVQDLLKKHSNLEKSGIVSFDVYYNRAFLNIKSGKYNSFSVNTWIYLDCEDEKYNLILRDIKKLIVMYQESQKVAI